MSAPLSPLGGPRFDSEAQDAAEPEPVTAAQAPVVRGPAAPAAVAGKFFDAFLERDFDSLERLYAPDAKFHDPLFDRKDGASTMKMQRALLSRAEGFQGTYKITGVEGDTVKVHWECDYKFAGRPVHNSLDTTLVVRNGKVVQQTDEWDWGKWARQALPLGKLGTTEPVHEAFKHIMRWFVG